MFPFITAKPIINTAQNRDSEDSIKSLEAMQGDQALISTVLELNELRKNADQLTEIS